jgi:hypothetical protein
MYQRCLLSVVGAFIVTSVSAQQLQVETGGVGATKPLDWSAAQWWTTPAAQVEGIRLAKSDYRVRGPVIDVFRKSPVREKRSLRQRFFGMPFVSPFATKRSNTPTQRTDYFAWGERAVPWSALADRPIPGPQCALMTVSR